MVIVVIVPQLQRAADVLWNRGGWVYTVGAAHLPRPGLASGVRVPLQGSQIIGKGQHVNMHIYTNYLPGYC